MRAVIQRVKSAKLAVDGKLISEIGKGFAVYLGVGKGDSEAEIELLAKKIAKMRIFEDENERMNLDLSVCNGQILLISQFTLYADCKDGNRPNFFDAEAPDRANELYEKMKVALEGYGIEVKTGVFGADMQIEQHNDGPVTIILDSDELNACKKKSSKV